MRFAKNVSAEKFAEWTQFADDNLPTHNLPKIWQIFNFYTVKKALNHDLPTYDLPKRHFNDANIVFTTCNDRQY